jgi:hypothetical protein
MQVEIEVTGADRVIAEVERIRPRMNEQLTQALRRAVLRIHHQVVSVELRGGTLRARTANLARAVFWRVEASAEAIVGRVGVDRAKAVYGRIQALGGTIRPTRAQHLTIPVGQALTGNGVARFTARELFDNPQAFGFRTAFVNPRKTAILGVRADKSVTPLFALKTEVTLPPRNYLRRAIDAVRPQIAEEVRRAVVAALRSSR